MEKPKEQAPASPEAEPTRMNRSESRVFLSPQHDLKDLKKRSVRSGAVTLLSQAANFCVNLVSTVVLARLLTPQDYGVVAMVLAVTAFAGLFKDLGLSAATIQRDELTQAQVSTLFWVNVLLGAVLTLALVALAPVLAWFYRKPEVLWVTVALSASFILSSLGIQHSALLNRAMRFRALAVVGISSSLVTMVASILAALAGWGYWALVTGTLVGAVSRTVFLWLSSRWIPGHPMKATGIRGLLRYGANITGFDVINYFSRNLDNILIGRVWGTDALGLYSKAYSLLMFPITNIRGPITTVAFPAMSQLQNDPARYRAYYRKVTALLAFASMPLAAFLFVTSDNVIRLLLGNRWIGASDIFCLLALTAFLQPAAGLRGLVLMSRGSGGRYLSLGVWIAAFTAAGFGIGVIWGPLGVAAAYGIVNYLMLYPTLRYTFKDTPLKVRDFFESTGRPAAASVVSAALVYAVKNSFYWRYDALVLLTCAVVFLMAYFALFRVLPGGLAEIKEYWAFRSFFRESWLRKPQPAVLVK